MTPAEEAQQEAEVTYQGFLKTGKYVIYGSLAFLFVVASCNFGVEDGPNKTGSGYNGEQYAPTNIGK